MKRGRAALLIVCLMAACRPAGGGFLEPPPPEGAWRPHRLTRCPQHPEPRGAVKECFDEAIALYNLANGGDAAVVLELALAEHGGHPWLSLLLAQIYLLAGQGEPHCLPLSGPAASRGDWPRDRLRLLERSEALLEQLGRIWPEDSVVDFLLADVARARDDHDEAAEHDHCGRLKCTHLESLELLRAMRDLRRRPAQLIASIEPVYPEAAARRRIQGEVLCDILIDPFGRVAEIEIIGEADPDLARAARQAIPGGGYQAAQMGYYPVWSWLRVPIRFRLGN